MTLCRLHIKYKCLHIILQLAQKKAEHDIVGKSFEDDEIKYPKAEKENTSKAYVCSICGIYSMYKEDIFDHVSNVHLNCTICNIQFNDLKSQIHNYFVKHKLELFCENKLKSEDHFASHGTTNHNVLILVLIEVMNLTFFQ